MIQLILHVTMSTMHRVCSVPEPSGMEWNRSAPRAHSCVRLWNGTEPSGSSKGNILPICRMHPFHRIGGMWWNGCYLAAINYKALH